MSDDDCDHFHFVDLYKPADVCGCTGPHRTTDETESGDPICLDSPTGGYACGECGHKLTPSDLAHVAREAKRGELDALKERNTALERLAAAVAAGPPSPDDAVALTTDWAVEITDYRGERVIIGPMSIYDCSVLAREKALESWGPDRPCNPVIIHRTTASGPWISNAQQPSG